jgi:hypothetical protein
MTKNQVVIEEQPAEEAAALLKTISEKGVAWAAAALIHGSIGYYSPSVALRIVNDFVRNKKLYGGAERTICCFKGNPYDEMAFDFKNFKDLSSYDEPRVKRLIQVVKALAKESTIESWSFSCAYPTMGF